MRSEAGGTGGPARCSFIPINVWMTQATGIPTPPVTTLAAWFGHRKGPGSFTLVASRGGWEDPEFILVDGFTLGLGSHWGWVHTGGFTLELGSFTLVASRGGGGTLWVHTGGWVHTGLGSSTLG